MNQRGYPSTSAQVRVQLEQLATLPDDSDQWAAFVKKEMRLPGWMLPAFRSAVREGGWRTTADPISQITFAVRRIAIEMRLSNPANASMVIEEEDEQDE